MKKTTKKRKPRTELRNGCSRTEVFISPENYKQLKNNSALEMDWFVECRFFDPKFKEKYPNGFQFRKRFNSFEKLSERKEAALIFKEEMENLLDVQNYNPISKIFMIDESGELSPYMDLKSALEIARKKITGSEKHLKQIRRCVSRINEAFDHLNYSFLNIKEIKLFHIKNALEFLNLPPYTYNKFTKTYLKRVFDELIEYGCLESNPCIFISRKKTVSEIREVISDKELKYIDSYLEENYPNFYRYKKIFEYSAGRSAELLRVQRKHVDLENQEYTVQIQKGRKYTWETKIIIKSAIPYWKEILSLCNDDEDYLFSKKLIPGPNKINPDQVTRRWKRLVKDSNKILDENDEVIKITADFYTHKHNFLDKIDEMHENTKVIPISSENPAKILANHKSDKMTDVYATGRSKRKNEALKKIKFG